MKNKLLHSTHQDWLISLLFSFLSPFVGQKCVMLESPLLIWQKLKKDVTSSGFLPREKEKQFNQNQRLENNLEGGRTLSG